MGVWQAGWGRAVAGEWRRHAARRRPRLSGRARQLPPLLEHWMNIGKKQPFLPGPRSRVTPDSSSARKRRAMFSPAAC